MNRSYFLDADGPAHPGAPLWPRRRRVLLAVLLLALLAAGLQADHWAGPALTAPPGPRRYPPAYRHIPAGQLIRQ